MSILDIPDFNFEDDESFLASCGVDVKKDNVSLGSQRNSVSETCTQNSGECSQTKTLSLSQFVFRPASTTKNKSQDDQKKLTTHLSGQIKHFEKGISNSKCAIKDETLKNKPDVVKRPLDSTETKEASLLDDCLSFDNFFEDEISGNAINVHSTSPVHQPCTKSSNSVKDVFSKELNSPSSSVSSSLLCKPVFSTPLSKNKISLDKRKEHLVTADQNTPTEKSVVSHMPIKNKTARKRKFPGPAGLLPDLPADVDLSLLEKSGSSVTSLCHDYSYNQEFVCSQATAEDFQSIPWQNMLKDLSECMDLEFMNHFNLQNMLKKSKKKLLPKHVVADVLCVLLSSLSVNGQEADAFFRDETGEIPGKIQTDVLIAFKEYLVPHTVIVLKEAMFLFNQLIIKQQNIVSIYCCDGEIIHVNSLRSNLTNLKGITNYVNDHQTSVCQKKRDILSDKDNQMISAQIGNCNSMVPISANSCSKESSDFDLSHDELDVLLQEVDNSFFDDVG